MLGFIVLLCVLSSKTWYKEKRVIDIVGFQIKIIFLSFMFHNLFKMFQFGSDKLESVKLYQFLNLYNWQNFQTTFICSGGRR